MVAANDTVSTALDPLIVDQRVVPRAQIDDEVVRGQERPSPPAWLIVNDSLPVSPSMSTVVMLPVSLAPSAPQSSLESPPPFTMMSSSLSTEIVKDSPEAISTFRVFPPVTLHEAACAGAASQNTTRLSDAGTTTPHRHRLPPNRRPERC
ncbi:MAG: hypothetical protein U0V56_00995 [Actinomycetota bacterium]